MKKQRVLKERIRRVKILFKELGYQVAGDERSEDTFTAGFRSNGGAEGGFFIDRHSRFLEIGYTFSFSLAMSDYLKGRLEDMLKIAYEFGCYFNLMSGKREIVFSVFTKVYFSGLNYYALKDSLHDFNQCVDMITEVLDIGSEETAEEEEVDQ